MGPNSAFLKTGDTRVDESMLYGKPGELIIYTGHPQSLWWPLSFLREKKGRRGTSIDGPYSIPGTLQIPPCIICLSPHELST
jgi:hypothetical protein